jgi:ABC-type sulfate/molybdate transport systems ATPase subunit
LEYLGFNSKRTAKQISKELESLRNNLAHSQDIVTHDWPQIARLAKRFEKILSR